MGLLRWLTVMMLAVLSVNLQQAVDAADASSYKLAYMSYTDHQIWTINPDGSDAKQISHDGVDKRELLASPDGQFIAYYVDTQYDSLVKQKISILDVATGEAQTITDDEAVTALAWSPDSQQLLFVVLNPHDAVGYTYTLNRINRDGSSRIPLSEGAGTGSGLSWSPDGKQILLSEQTANGYELFLIDADGTNKRQLTNFNNCFICYSPQWSADSQAIVFYKHPDLFMIAADGQHQRQLTNFASIYNVSDVYYARYGAPSFSLSADGQTVYYTMGFPQQMVKLDLSDEGWAKRTVLYDDPKNMIAGNLLSPDGKLLFFNADSPDGYQLNVLDLATQKVQLLETNVSPAVILKGS